MIVAKEASWDWRDCLWLLQFVDRNLLTIYLVNDLQFVFVSLLFH